MTIRMSEEKLLLEKDRHIYLFINLLFYTFQVFHTSFNQWFFIEVWVTESNLRFPKLFEVF